MRLARDLRGFEDAGMIETSPRSAASTGLPSVVGQAGHSNPAKLLVLLGAALATAGVLPWLLFALGLRSLYEPIFRSVGFRSSFHPLAQVEGFLACFAI